MTKRWKNSVGGCKDYNFGVDGNFFFVSFSKTENRTSDKLFALLTP